MNNHSLETGFFQWWRYCVWYSAEAESRWYSDFFLYFWWM